MNKLKTIWLRLGDNGLHAAIPHDEARVLRLLNNISVMGMVICIMNTLGFFGMGAPPLGWASLIGFPFFALPFLLINWKQYFAARLIAPTIIPIYFMGYSIYFGEAIGLEYMLLVTCLAPLMFFSRMKFILPLTALNLVYFILCRLSFDWRTPPYDLDIFGSIYYFNLIVIFAVLFVIVNIFKSEHINYETIIEKKNKDITDSIHYAKRIQGSLLGDEKAINQFFKEAFILFRPKDIVSGDFYWVAQVHINASTLTIVIAADCTGHGVPGAFMTVLGNSLLNEIIHERGIWEPSQILTELDKKVVEALQNQAKGEGANDGMDMSVIVWDEQKRQLYFAGAKNPMFYVRDGKIEQIKGSKFPIGSSQYREGKQFDQQVLEVQSGDTFYLFSDGYQDQFGGSKRKKYMSKKFRSFLEGISSQPMASQHAALEKELEDWMGEVHQTDDILVIGVQV